MIFVDIRRAYNFLDLRQVFVECTQDISVFLSAFHAGGILFMPGFLKPERGSLMSS